MEREGERRRMTGRGSRDRDASQCSPVGESRPGSSRERSPAGSRARGPGRGPAPPKWGMGAPPGPRHPASHAEQSAWPGRGHAPPEPFPWKPPHGSGRFPIGSVGGGAEFGWISPASCAHGFGRMVDICPSSGDVYSVVYLIVCY